MEEITEDEYYNRLLGLWNGMVDGTLDSKTWLNEYDVCFKLCVLDKEQMIYNAFKRLFDTVSKTDIDHQLYCKASNSMTRLGAYLHRFWIPNEKNVNAEIVEIYRLSELAWEKNH